MEKDFQTSFIPKKPMIEERPVSSRPVGIFMAAAFFILFVVIILSGGLYFYNGVLSKNIKEMETNLNLAKGRFEPSKIVQLQLLDKRLKAATSVLSTHVAISPIFKSLQEITMKSVRFTKFSYSVGSLQDAQKIEVKMSGAAVGYRSIALQADLFARNKFFIDPVFSNLSLDEKGNVVFDLEFVVDPTFVDYKQNFLIENNQVSEEIQ